MNCSFKSKNGINDTKNQSLYSFILGPTVTQSSAVPVFDNLFCVAIESTGEDSGPLRFLLGVGVCTVFLPVGVENRLLFIWSVLGIFPGVSIGNDSCSFRLFRGLDSLAFSANFRLGVVNAPIPGWDFLLPWGIFSGITISKFADMLPLHSTSKCRFTCMQ